MDKLKSRFGALGRAALVPVVGGAALVAGSAFADGGGIDITAATSGIAAAQTAVLGVLAAMLGMGVAVWGVRKVLRFFGR
jgi:predicted phage tail protein